MNMISARAVLVASLICWGCSDTVAKNDDVVSNNADSDVGQGDGGDIQTVCAFTHDNIVFSLAQAVPGGGSVVTGAFTGEVTLGGETFVAEPDGDRESDLLVVKLSSSCVVEWASAWYSTAASVNSIVANESAIFLGGQVIHGLRIDDRERVDADTLSAAVVAYDHSGNVLWEQVEQDDSGTADTNGTIIHGVHNGTLYVSFWVQISATFGGVDYSEMGGNNNSRTGVIAAMDPVSGGVSWITGPIRDTGIGFLIPFEEHILSRHHIFDDAYFAQTGYDGVPIQTIDDPAPRSGQVVAAWNQQWGIRGDRTRSLVYEIAPSGVETEVARIELTDTAVCCLGDNVVSARGSTFRLHDSSWDVTQQFNTGPFTSIRFSASANQLWVVGDGEVQRVR